MGHINPPAIHSLTYLQGLGRETEEQQQEEHKVDDNNGLIIKAKWTMQAEQNKGFIHYFARQMAISRKKVLIMCNSYFGRQMLSLSSPASFPQPSQLDVTSHGME